MTSRDLRWPEVTLSYVIWPGHLEVALEDRKLAYTVHFTTYKPVSRRRRQSHDRKWHHMTSVNGSGPKVTLFDRKSPWSVCRGPKTGISCTFHFLQGCSSQEDAVTLQEMTSRDLRWPEVARKRRHLTGSHVEVAVEVRKLAYVLYISLPVPWVPSDRRGGVPGPLGPVWPPWGRGRSPETRLATVKAWPVPWAPFGCHGGVGGPLGPVLPPRGRGRSPGPRLSPWWLGRFPRPRLYAVGAWLTPEPGLATVRAWPVPWAPPGCHGSVAGPLG